MDVLLRILTTLGDSIVEIFVVLFGALSSFIANEVIKFFKEKRKQYRAEKRKKDMDIINQVTDKVALEVDSLYPDVTYEEQRQIAIDKAKIILAGKDVDISDEELSIEVEDGFSKLPNYYDDVVTAIEPEIEEVEDVHDQIVEEEPKPLKSPVKRSKRRIHNTKHYVIQSDEQEENLIIFYSKKGSV